VGIEGDRGRGFVPSENVFVARLEGVEGSRRSQRLPNNRRGFWGIALRGHQSELHLQAVMPDEWGLDPARD
jgi:hypothetical protein